MVARFIGIVLHYWMQWVTGTGIVGFSLWVYNYISSHHLEGWWIVSKKAYAIILFCTFWFLATFFAWRDADRNLTTVVAQRQEDTSKLGWCEVDSRVFQTRAELLGRQNILQQQTIESQQGNISTQQSSVNSCVTWLTKVNTPQKQAVTNKIANFFTMANISVVVATTNYAMQPTNLQLRCAEEFTIVDARMAGTASHSGGVSIDTRSGGISQPDKNTAEISIGSPAWTPEKPLVIIVKGAPSTCEVKQN